MVIGLNTNKILCFYFYFGALTDYVLRFFLPAFTVDVGPHTCISDKYCMAPKESLCRFTVFSAETKASENNIENQWRIMVQQIHCINNNNNNITQSIMYCQLKSCLCVQDSRYTFLYTPTLQTLPVV